MHPRVRDGLFAISAMMMMGYGSVFTLLAVIREHFGFDETAIGWIGASGFAAGFVVQVSLSRLADRGHAGRMLWVGLVLASASSLLMCFAESLSAWIACRALLGVGSGCFAPALRRVAVMSDPSNAGHTLGRLASFEFSGFLIGPVLASLLHGWLGLRAPFVAVGLGLVAMAPLLARIDVPREVHDVPRGTLRGLARLPAIQATLAAGVAFYLTVGVFEAIWAVFMADRGASQLFIGLTLSLFTLPMVFIAPRAGVLAQERGPLRVAGFSIGAATLCMLAYGHVFALPLLCVVLAIHSVADAFTMPALQLAMTRATGPAALATGQGLLGATNLAVAAGAALGAGWLYENFGSVGLWTTAGIVMAFLVGLALWRGPELRLPESRATVLRSPTS